MKRNVMFKRLLPMLLFVLGLCVTSTTYAQDANTNPSTTTEDAVGTFVDEATALQDITAAIVSLKVSAESLTPGSEAYVSVVRRVEVFAESMLVLQAGETVQIAYAAGLNHLYNVIEAKEADAPSLGQIQQALYDLINN
jgi:hypothetical protein